MTKEEYGKLSSEEKEKLSSEEKQKFSTGKQGKQSFKSNAKKMWKDTKDIAKKETIKGLAQIGSAIVQGIAKSAQFTNHPSWYGGETLRATALVGGAAKVPTGYLNVVFAIAKCESDPRNLIDLTMVTEEINSALQLFNTYIGIDSGITSAIITDVLQKQVLALAWAYTAVRTQSSRNVIPVNGHNYDLEDFVASYKATIINTSVMAPIAAVPVDSAILTAITNSLPSHAVTLGVWSKYDWEVDVISRCNKLMLLPDQVSLCQYLYTNYFVNNDTIGANSYLELYPETGVSTTNIKTQANAALAAAVAALNSNPYLKKFLSILGFSQCVPLETLDRDQSALSAVVVSDLEFYASLLNRNTPAASGQPILVANLTDSLELTDDIVVEDIDVGTFMSLYKSKLLGINPVAMHVIVKVASSTFSTRNAIDIEGAVLEKHEVGSVPMDLPRTDTTWTLAQNLAFAYNRVITTSFLPRNDVLGLEDLTDSHKYMVFEVDTTHNVGEVLPVVTLATANEQNLIFGVDVKSISDWDLLVSVGKSNFTWGKTWRSAALKTLVDINTKLNPR